MNYAADGYQQRIGSPRMMSPRSHRTHRSHRAQDYYTTLRYPGNVETHDNISEPPIPENLHGDNSAFNVDPDAPILGAGEQEIREAQEAEASRHQPRSDRSFVGGFVVGLKKAFKPSINWGSGSRQHDAEAAEAPFNYNFETPYYEPTTPLPRVPTDVEFNVVDSQSPSSYSTSPPTSETMHAAPEYLDDGTTAVDHQMAMPAPAHVVDPVLVEPQLAPDYLKMESTTAPASEASLNTYVSRIAKFFREINNLPWVAERVTVDYYPGQLNRRMRPRATHRPVLSWYNRHVFPSGDPGGQAVSLDLTAGSSASSSPTPMRPQPLYQSFIIAPTNAAQSPEMQQTAPSTHAPSIVYTVVNPSAATSSSTESPQTAPVGSRRADPERTYAQQLSGYTPVQPNPAAFGPAVHAGYAGGAPVASTR